jgi:hypothetical protein
MQLAGGLLDGRRIVSADALADTFTAGEVKEGPSRISGQSVVFALDGDG